MKKCCFWLIGIILACCIVGQAGALLVPLDESALVRGSDAVIIGTVRDIESRWNGDRTSIETFTQIGVLESIHGNPVPDDITVVTHGGMVEGIYQWTEYAPIFFPSSTVGLFLKEMPDGKYTVYGHSKGLVYFPSEADKKDLSPYKMTQEDFKMRINDIAEGKPVQPPEKFLPFSPTAGGPTITSVTPAIASAGTDTQITITGTGFGTKASRDSDADVVFTSVPFGEAIIYASGFVALAPNWQTINQNDIVSWSDTKIVVRVPTGLILRTDPDTGEKYHYWGSASSGSLFVAKDNQETSNSVDFTVTFGAGKGGGIYSVPVGAKWKWSGPSPNVVYQVNPGPVPGALPSAQSAVNTWNAVPNTGFRFSYGGESSSSNFTRNGRNEILFVNFNDSSLLAGSTYWFYSNGYFIEQDTVLNTDYSWSSNPGQSDYDSESVVLHEVGHWLQLRDLYGSLGNPPDTPKAMFGYIGKDQIKRTLHADDIAGIQWLYPPSLALPWVYDYDSCMPDTTYLLNSFSRTKPGYPNLYHCQYLSDSYRSECIPSSWNYFVPVDSDNYCVDSPPSSVAPYQTDEHLWLSGIYYYKMKNYPWINEKTCYMEQSWGCQISTEEYFELRECKSPVPSNYKMCEGHCYDPDYYECCAGGHLILKDRNEDGIQDRKCCIEEKKEHDIYNPFTKTFFHADVVDYADSGWGADILNDPRNCGGCGYKCIAFSRGACTDIAADNSYVCSGSTSQCSYGVCVTPPPLKAIFTTNVTAGLPPLGVQFTDISTGSPVKWNWSFGDGTWFNTTVASLKNATHTYSATGTYTARLSVCNATACDTTVPGTTITVGTSGAVPFASFLTNVTSGYTPLAVRFIDQSAGLSLNKWNWSFGDGTWFNTTSVALKNPAHIYGNGGTYNARLTVCNATGCNTTIPGRAITVTSLSVPIIKFMTNVTSGNAPLAVKFTDMSTGSPTKWNWSFGDGTWLNTSIASQKSPAHVYTSGGIYTAKLIACNAAGCNTTAPGKTITVTSLAVPTVKFVTNVSSGYTPLAVKFTDMSTGSPTKWNWSFGDSSWFNTTVVSQKSPVHIYSSAGTYTARLIACNAAGCNTTAPGKTITVNTLSPPIVKFVTNRTSGAAPLPVKFIDQSTGGPTDWRWGFGDGSWFNTTVVSLKNPAHTYTVPGSYPSRLIACNAAGCNTTAPARTIAVS